MRNRIWIFCLAALVSLSRTGLAAQKVTHWVAPTYAEVQFGLQIEGACDDRTCNGGVKRLSFWAHVTDVSLIGRSSQGQVFAAFSDNPMKEILLRGTRGAWRMFGHTKGKAELRSVELCRFYNGKNYENQRITNRNEKYSVALRTLGGQEAQNLMYPPKPDSDTVPVAPLPNEVYMIFEASTPYGDPALEIQNSVGSSVINGFSVIFSISVEKLLKGDEIAFTEPYTSNSPCEKGEWTIWFFPAGKKK